MAARKSSKRRRSSRRPARRSQAVRRRSTRRAKVARRRSPRRVPTSARPRRRAKAARKTRKPAKRRRTKRAQPRRAIRAHGRQPKPKPKRTRNGRPALLERERRRLPDSERLDATRPLTDERLLSAARTGHDELKAALSKHTETSPVLTAGDVDAKWQDAAAIGDEAPGGDNPTPDQDRVDDIGKALGVQYRDDQELAGGDEIRERDRHRWELDPASSDDWPHDKKKK